MGQKPWGAFPMPGEEPVCWTFGPLQVWGKSTIDEFWITQQYRETGEAAEQLAGEDSRPDLPEKVDWQRWALKQSYQEVLINPIFPDFPVVVKPEYPFRVTPGVRTKIYVRVPVWVKISLGKTSIIKLPSVILSKTWFGEFTGGELCYWISSAARKKIEPDPRRPFLSICPVQIINHSRDELQVEKICLRVSQLGLYYAKDQLWSNETRVHYHGGEEGSEIETRLKPPADARNAKLLTPPVEYPRRSFTAKTFASLKDLTDRIF